MLRRTKGKEIEVFGLIWRIWEEAKRWVKKKNERERERRMLQWSDLSLRSAHAIFLEETTCHVACLDVGVVKRIGEIGNLMVLWSIVTCSYTNSIILPGSSFSILFHFLLLPLYPLHTHFSFFFSHFFIIKPSISIWSI